MSPSPEHIPADSTARPLPQSRDWLQALFSDSPAAMGFSRDGVMLDANPAYVKLFGYASVADLRGQPLIDHIAPSHRADIRERIARRARGESMPFTYESRGLRKDGTEFPFQISTNRVVLPDGPLTIAFIVDLSERERVTRELTDALALNQVVLGTSTVGCLVYEVFGPCLFANDAVATIVGAQLPQVLAQNFHDLASWKVSGMFASAAAAIEKGEPQQGRAHFVSSFGREVWVDYQFSTAMVSGRKVLLGFLRDTTAENVARAALQANEERLRQTQQLESLGVLAGGIAHDFNNILTVIMGGASIARRELGPDSPANEHLVSIGVAAQRAADLCRQMLAYAGRAQLAMQPLDLNALITEMVGILEVSVPKKAALVRALEPRLAPIVGDPTQIRQVLMNLVINAAEAIAGPSGTINVSTTVLRCDGACFERAVLGSDRPPGEYACLTVQDDGIGMDGTTVARMFDPFFTTKFAGRGLGMAAVLGIVRSHGGAIDVESEPGRGTRIRVFFPLRKETVVAPRTPPPVEFRGQGLVLVVDDEAQVRRTTARLFEELGFEVLTAAEGAEAVKLFTAHQGKVVLVFMDLTMPQMDGAEALVAIRRLDPTAKVVLVSGYGAAHLAGRLGEERPDEVLEKPYRWERLIEVLRRVTPAAP